MNKQEGLDSAILSALLKGRGASNLDQLKLALTWDRSDIAEEKIFSQNIDWPRGWPFIHTSMFKKNTPPGCRDKFLAQ